MKNQLIKDRLEKLPVDLQQEVLDFIEFLIDKNRKKEEKGNFKFDWEGGLSELKDKFTSVELQHKALDWR